MVRDPLLNIVGISGPTEYNNLISCTKICFENRHGNMLTYGLAWEVSAVHEGWGWHDHLLSKFWWALQLNGELREQR